MSQPHPAKRRRSRSNLRLIEESSDQILRERLRPTANQIMRNRPLSEELSEVSTADIRPKPAIDYWARQLQPAQWVRHSDF
jgi:hypothetical protein